MSATIDTAAANRLLMEQLHDFIQRWSDGKLPYTVETFGEATKLRLQIDAYLGYCPHYEPELRSDAPVASSSKGKA
jgi:hypothetical protein